MKEKKPRLTREIFLGKKKPLSMAFFKLALGLTDLRSHLMVRIFLNKLNNLHHRKKLASETKEKKVFLTFPFLLDLGLACKEKKVLLEKSKNLDFHICRK